MKYLLFGVAFTSLLHSTIDTTQSTVPTNVVEQSTLPRYRDAAANDAFYLPSYEGLKPTKYAPLAASLAIVPGLGHIYLGDYATAGSFLGSAAASYVFATQSHNFVAVYSGIESMQTIMIYGIYAAYRDARSFNGPANYHYPMPKDSFSDLIYAPFEWKTISKPEVWAGIFGTLAVGTALSTWAYGHIAPMSISLADVIPFTAFPIGIREEALFRGFLQPALSEIATPIGGWILSSLAFGAAHLSNAHNLPSEYRQTYYTVSIPYIAAFGAYAGWLAQKNRSLKECVAVHAWYDFTLFALEAAAMRATTNTPKHFSMAWTF